jgi:alpha-tubulin suppressor-like RCC1 family protein
MSVYPEKITISYVSKGEKEFVIPFNFLENESVKVFCGDERIEQILNKDFTVNDGYVIFAENVPDGVIVRIERQTDLTQTAKFLNNAKLPADVLNFSFDKVIMICQELAEKLKRALLSAEDSNITLDDIMKDIEAVRDFASSGNALSDAAAKAAVSAAQALISAIEARQYRDTAKEFSDKAVAASDITAHNEYEKSHPYILNLIEGLKTIFEQHETHYEQHIEDYEQHKTDNTEAHHVFEEFNTETDKRLDLLESAAALNKGNHFFTFGFNNYAQLGVNLNVTVNTAPVEHTGMRNVSKVATSQTCGAAIAGGRLYVTGLGGGGFCGSKLIQNFGYNPHDCVDSIYGWTDVAVFNEVGMAIRDGKLYSWGRGDLSCLGDGTVVTRAVPREIVIPDEKFVSVAAGPCVFLALTESGRIYSCGVSEFGALGHAQGYEVNNNMTLISSLENVVQIAAGGLHSDKYYNFCAAIKKKEGEQAQLYVWGWNGYGNLGMNNYTSLSAPTIVNLPFEPQKVSCGLYHMAILSTDGKIYLAGHQAVFWQQGHQLTFKAIESDDIYVDVAAGVQVTYMLTSYKHLYGQGESVYGSLLGQQSSGVPVELQQGNIEKIFCNSQQYGCAFTVPEETDND